MEIVTTNDKTIGTLPVAEALYDDSLLPMEQDGTAMALSGAMLKTYAAGAAQDAAREATTAAGEAALAAQTALDALDRLVVDTAPTQGSTNLVSSGGVYQAIADAVGQFIQAEGEDF